MRSLDEPFSRDGSQISEYRLDRSSRAAPIGLGHKAFLGIHGGDAILFPLTHRRRSNSGMARVWPPCEATVRRIGSGSAAPS